MPEMTGGLEAAGGAAVAQQRLGRQVKRALHLRLLLRLSSWFAGDPFAGRQQRGTVLEMAHVPMPGLGGRVKQGDDGFNYINRRGNRIFGLEPFQSFSLLARAACDVGQQRCGEGKRLRRVALQTVQALQGVVRAV